MLTGLKIFTSIRNSEFAVNFRWKCHNTSNKIILVYTVIYDLPLITVPVSNCHLFSDINISQDSVTTRLRCGGIFSYYFTANLSLSLTIKEFWKPVKIWQIYRHEFSGPVFRNTVYIGLSIPVYIHLYLFSYSMTGLESIKVKHDTHLRN